MITDFELKTLDSAFSLQLSKGLVTISHTNSFDGNTRSPQGQ
jgi:hypothetical protein